MLLTELDQIADLSEALAKANADVGPAEENLAAAERTLAAAESERMRVQRVYGELTSRIASLFDRQKEQKLRAMQLTANSLDDQTAWATYTRIRTEREHAIASFEYVSLFELEDAVRASLVAEIAERTAVADSIEAKAVRARVGMLQAASQALAFDPSTTLDTKDSWSSREMEKAQHIRKELLPSLREQLEQHDARVERNRAAMNGSLWA